MQKVGQIATWASGFAIITVVAFTVGGADQRRSDADARCKARQQYRVFVSGDRVSAYFCMDEAGRITAP